MMTCKCPTFCPGKIEELSDISNKNKIKMLYASCETLVRTNQPQVE